MTPNDSFCSSAVLKNAWRPITKIQTVCMCYMVDQLLLRPCQGGPPGRLSEFQNVPRRHFLIVLSEVRVAVGNLFDSTAVCRYFIWVLSLLFGPCRLSEFTLAGPHYCYGLGPLPSLNDSHHTKEVENRVTTQWPIFHHNNKKHAQLISQNNKTIASAIPTEKVYMVLFSTDDLDWTWKMLALPFKMLFSQR